MSPFISAYRKNYNTQYVLLRLLEKWRKHLDIDYFPHDIFLAKLAAYGIDDNLILCVHSYLLNHKQCVRISNILSEFNKVVYCVPQGSIVGHVIFNCFFNDFYDFIKNANAHKFANDKM